MLCHILVPFAHWYKLNFHMSWMLLDAYFWISLNFCSNKQCSLCNMSIKFKCFSYTKNFSVLFVEFCLQFCSCYCYNISILVAILVITVYSTAALVRIQMFLFHLQCLMTLMCFFQDAVCSWQSACWYTLLTMSNFDFFQHERVSAVFLNFFICCVLFNFWYWLHVFKLLDFFEIY